MNAFEWALPGSAGPRKASRQSQRTLAERMGYPADANLLIVNCDDLGSSRSANIAIERALRRGIASSATIMIPCPWAEAAAESCRDLDIGVHLTLTSEYPVYRWKSLTDGRSLHDRDGYLPRTTQEVWARAELADVEAECRAQIDRALAWGLDVTHIDSHMDTMQLDRHYFDVYLRVAADYRLPVRLRRPSFEWPFSHISRATVDRAQVVTTDRFVAPPWGEASQPSLLDCIRKPAAGVTEVALHPVEDGEELRAYDTEYADLRVSDAACLIDNGLHDMLAANAVTLIGFRPLREAMRAAD